MDKYITIVVDPGQKIFAVEKQVFLTANEEGLVRLNVSDLTVEFPKSVLGFERELQSLLSEDEQYALFEFLGKSKGITITSLAFALDVSKQETRHIINLGMKYKVLVPGWNNTSKVADTVVRERLLERAKNRFTEDKHNIQPNTIEERLIALRKKGLIPGNEKATHEGEESSVVKAIPASIASGKVTPVTVKKDSSELTSNLKKELAVLEKKLSETKDNEWDENETPYTVVDKINKIKNQLKTLDMGTPIPTTPSHSKTIPATMPVPGKLPARKRKSL